MKKLLYSVLALTGIIAVSCNKEADAPQAAPELTGKTHTVTLKAAFAPEGETKTAYANNKTFSWVEGDVVYVRVINEENYWYWAAFTAESTGAETNLTGEVEDGYEPYDVAVYVPGPNYVGTVVYNESSVRVVAPISYHQDGYGLGTDSEGDVTPYWNSVSMPSDNPLSLLPLVSVTKDDVLYFQTAMGVLELNLTDVPAEATHVRITTSEGVLGNYLMVQDGEIRMSEAWADDDGQIYATSFAEYYFEPVSDGKVSFMMPLPVGTLKAGSQIDVLDANDKALFTKRFMKDVVITRNKITKLAALSTKVEWTSLGKGMFGDHYHFNVGYEQEVEIQQNAADPTEFRLVDPYAGYRDILEYEATGEEYGPDPYLSFRILQKGEKVAGVTVTHDDLVWFDVYYNGIVDDAYGVDPFLTHPSHWSASFDENTWLRSIVVKYQADGKTPANVQLAPIFMWVTNPGGSNPYTGDSYLYDNDIIEIRFPEAARIDLNVSASFVEISDDNSDQALGVVDVSLGNGIAGADVVIAANESAAVSALADPSRVTTVTATGECEVKLPAKAPSGDYYIYLQTKPADGLTAAAAQLVVSEKFYYSNKDSDLGLDVSELYGTWSGDIVRKEPSSDYYTETFTMTFAETDNPFEGDVLITEIYGLESSIPAYGWFDGKTGILSIASGQPWALASDTYAVGLVDANSPTSVLEFRYREDKSLYLQSCEFVAFYLYDAATLEETDYWLGYFYGYSPDYHLTMTKTTSSSAPAKVMGKRGAVTPAKVEKVSYASANAMMAQ